MLRNSTINKQKCTKIVFLALSCQSCQQQY